MKEKNIAGKDVAYESYIIDATKRLKSNMSIENVQNHLHRRFALEVSDFCKPHFYGSKKNGFKKGLKKICQKYWEALSYVEWFEEINNSRNVPHKDNGYTVSERRIYHATNHRKPHGTSADPRGKSH